MACHTVSTQVGAGELGALGAPGEEGLDLVETEGGEVGAAEVAEDGVALGGGEGGQGAGLVECYPVLEGVGVPAEGSAEEGGVTTAVEGVVEVSHEEDGVDAGGGAFGSVFVEGFEDDAVDFGGGRGCAVEMAVGELILAEGF